jgi:3-oxoacyl-[acyl-carrier protein] reductase
MREQDEGGRIIVVGSPAGQRGNFGQTNYAAVKAGIVAFARTWALELARARITVNAIIPTAWTEMTASIPAYAPLVERVERGEPLPRQVREEHAVGMPEDCAPLVLFLASEASAEVSGQAIALGGDRLALWTHPQEKLFLLREDGWSAEAIAQAWSEQLAAAQESYGVVFAELDLG